MKSRRKTKVQHKSFTRRTFSLSPKLESLMSEYWDLVVEYQTRQQRFKTEYNECMRWKKQNSNFFCP